MSEHFSFPLLAVSYEKRWRSEGATQLFLFTTSFSSLTKPTHWLDEPLGLFFIVLMTIFRMVWKQKASHMQNLTGQVWALRNLACIICHYWERVGVSLILPICAAGVSSLPGHFHR